MKLREIIENLDKSDKNKISVDFYDLGKEFDFRDDYLSLDGRLTSYYIFKWYCTDTYVGYKAYFLDDKLVAISFRPFRKSSENIYWVSSEMKEKVYNYLLAFVIKEINFTVDLMDLDEDWGMGHEIEFSQQLLTDIVIYEPTKEKVKIIEKYENIDMWRKVKIQFDNKEEMVVSLKNILVPFEVIEK